MESVSDAWDIFGLEEDIWQDCHRGRGLHATGDRQAGPMDEGVKVSNCFEALQEEEKTEEKWVQWCAEGKGGEVLGSDGRLLWIAALQSLLVRGIGRLSIPPRRCTWRQRRNFLNASGGRMESCGEKKVCCEFLKG